MMIEISPMLHQCRQQSRGFDHPRNRSPEVREKFEQRVAFLFRQFVVAILRQPTRRLRLRETTSGASRLGLRFRVRCLRLAGFCACACVRLLLR